jgi:hypothetical protein
MPKSILFQFCLILYLLNIYIFSCAVKGYKSRKDETRIKMMFRKCEHWHSNVWENEVLC